VKSVSERELCAAFYLERPDPDPASWVADVLAGIGVQRTWIWRPSAQTPVPIGEVTYAEWAGLECEVWVRDLAHLRVLALVFRQNAFLDLVDLDAEGPVEQDGAIAVAHAFKDACEALAPEAAFVVTNPVSDLDGFLAEQESAVVTLDELALVKGPFGLVYLPEALAAGLDPVLRLDPRDELPVRGGRLIFAGTGARRWWG